MPPETERWIITGRVQGVGFRAATEREARRLGLRGYVRNGARGEVEVVVAGPPAAVAALRRFVSQGPRGAKVDNLSAGTIEAELGASFEIR